MCVCVCVCVFGVGLEYVFRVGLGKFMVGLECILFWFRMCVCVCLSLVQGWSRLVPGWFRVCLVLV